VGGEGSAAGAVYMAESGAVLEIVPRVALPPAIPFTLQVTAWSGLPEPVTPALNVCAAPVAMLVEFGETLTTTSLLSVTLAEALIEGAAWLVAVTVMLPVEGRICGAVYRPAFETVPAVELPPAMPFTLQVTAVFGVPLTSAVNDSVPPRNTAALEGITVTLMIDGGGGDDDPPVLPHPASNTARARATPGATRRRLHVNRSWSTPNLSSITPGSRQRVCQAEPGELPRLVFLRPGHLNPPLRIATANACKFDSSAARFLAEEEIYAQHKPTTCFAVSLWNKRREFQPLLAPSLRARAATVFSARSAGAVDRIPGAAK
jgi:hypothetical protein